MSTPGKRALNTYATGAAIPKPKCPHGQPSIESCAGCQNALGERGKDHCSCGAAPTGKRRRNGGPASWECGTQYDNYGHRQTSPKCVVDSGLDRGPQPETCPWCGARVTKQTWRRWDYACGSVAIREGAHYSRGIKNDMGDRCILRVLEQRDEAANDA